MRELDLSDFCDIKLYITQLFGEDLFDVIHETVNGALVVRITGRLGGIPKDYGDQIILELNEFKYQCRTEITTLNGCMIYVSGKGD